MKLLRGELERYNTNTNKNVITRQKTKYGIIKELEKLNFIIILYKIFYFYTLVEIVKPTKKISIQTQNQNRVSFFLIITVNFFKISLKESKIHFI